MEQYAIRIGNFFFHWRNKLFPIIIVGLFALAVPPSTLFHAEGLEEAKDILAIIIAISGLAIRFSVIGFAYIKRGGLNKRVYAENLVTEGIFGICRNPLYVGNMLIYSGVFLMHGNVWVMSLGILFFFGIYQCIILAEEEYLRNKFASAYDAYCADVPRWIPQISRLREVTEGMRFDFRKAVLKDYPTIAMTIIMLTLTEGYEEMVSPNWMANLSELTPLVALVVALGIFTLAVRVYKKRVS